MAERRDGAGSETAPGDDSAPGAVDERHGNLQSYVIGLVLATGLTLASFGAAGTQLVWGPGIPVLLAVLAIAQMGIHLVFFLHISSAPDQTNNFLALAFGVMVVGLVIVGSLWIISNLNANMMPMDRMMDMHQQR